jgi:lipopolysaccharide/colanic/teichoic acid biosynthesis glycosyltransferase
MNKNFFYRFSKRAFDLMSAGALFVVTLPVFAVIAIAIKATSPGPLFHISDRVGRHNRIFRMLKFRTMRTDTPQVATHLMTEPGQIRHARGADPAQNQPGRTAPGAECDQGRHVGGRSPAGPVQSG